MEETKAGAAVGEKVDFLEKNVGEETLAIVNRLSPIEKGKFIDRLAELCKEIKKPEYDMDGRLAKWKESSNQIDAQAAQAEKLKKHLTCVDKHTEAMFLEALDLIRSEHQLSSDLVRDIMTSDRESANYRADTIARAVALELLVLRARITVLEEAEVKKERQGPV